MELLRSLLISLLLLLCFTSSILVLSQDPQAGFISLDCGTPRGENYTDSKTGLNYISDANFIGDNDNAVGKIVSPYYKDLVIDRQLIALTTFPQGIRNCYTLRPARGKLNKYLIRARFFYGNYDGNADKQLPQFDVHLGAEYWDTVKFDPKYDIISVDKEIVHIPYSDLVHVCLVNTGLGTPFISALELRPLNNSMYPTASGGSLMMNMRFDIGSMATQVLRYKDDVFDRMWVPFTMAPATPVNTTSTVTVRDSNVFKVPPGVMNTGLVPSDPTKPLTFWWPTNSSSDKLYIYMSFAEIQELKPNQTREFNIYLNGEFYFGPIAPPYLRATTLFGKTPDSNRTEYNFSLNKTQNSTLPPIINALEVYYLKEFNVPLTDDNDAAAMINIKSVYGVGKNWQGDPCSPASYAWIGLKCNYPGFSSPRIISMNLSSSGLTGSISPYISDLKMIQVLDLSNNNLTGPIPDFLSQLPSLSVLNLSGNNFSGPVPAKLLQKSKQGNLTLSIESVGSSTNSCQSGSCDDKKKKNVVVPVVASVAAVLLLVLAIVGIFLLIKWRKQREAKVDGLQTKNRRYSFTEIREITNNFERVLGKGGFGTVYYGSIDGTQVAVKMLSSTSGQGFKEFQAEDRLQIAVDSAQGKAPDQEHITHWVTTTLENGDIKDVIDPRLLGEFDVNSAWKAVELAMACVSQDADQRPTMNVVVNELKECLATEMARQGTNSQSSINNSSIATFDLESGPVASSAIISKPIMEVLRRRRSLLIALFLLSFTSSNVVLEVLSQDPGFITLNCGGENFTADDNTGLRYTSDATFIADNVNAVSNTVAERFKNIIVDRQWRSLTSFPKGIRNCYTLRPAQGKLNKYLIRARFFYGNYDGNADKQLPQFDLHLGVQYWDTVVFDPKDDTSVVDKEIIHYPSSDLIHVCLVNTGLGTPFISVLELRPLNISMYPAASGGWSLMMKNQRFDIGSTSPLLRYKADVFDRMWYPLIMNNATLVNTSSTDNLLTNDDFFNVPPAVISTAAVPSDPTQPFTIGWSTDNSSDMFYICMSFAEIQQLKPNQTREFNVYLNGDLFFSDPIVPPYMSTTTLYTNASLTSSTEYILSLNKTKNSTLPPIINALEIYFLKQFNEPQTDNNDVAAMFGIKSDYGVTNKNWQGDPCSPVSYSWNGLKCNYTPSNPPRITSIDLSNNKLTGPIPDFLSQLPSLSILIESVDPNTNSCQNNGSCDHNKKKKNIVVPALVASVLLLVLAIVVILLVVKRRKQRAGNQNVLSFRDRLQIAADSAQGQPAIIGKAPDQAHISRWVTSMLKNGNIRDVVDPRLMGEFDVNSAWKAIELAMACVSQDSGKRPTMNEVVSELKDCLATEMARHGGTTSQRSFNNLPTATIDSEFGPMAR
nr:putative leucine-rich repeat receptor-like protein kinase At2g19210 [Ipomoea trifida]